LFPTRPLDSPFYEERPLQAFSPVRIFRPRDVRWFADAAGLTSPGRSQMVRGEPTPQPLMERPAA
jgi:hypothetical protein